jgi:ABC-type multidrug transport system ATPase subunit
MNEVEDLCDNIIFIDKGEMKDYRTVESALNEYKNMYEYYK